MSDDFATFGHLAERGCSAIYTCMGLGFHCHGALHITGTEGVERFGPDTTIEQVRRRIRCRCCGHRGPRIIVEVFTPDGPSGGFLGPRLQAQQQRG